MSITTRTKYLFIAIAIFIIEVLIATVFAHISFIRGSLGDFLVVALIYFFIQSIKRFKPVHLAAGVFLFACAVEIAQYFHLADMLHFHEGSVPYILLGNSFSGRDIVMYLLGSIGAGVVDGWYLRGRRK
jgi:hypothetical protein